MSETAQLLTDLYLTCADLAVDDRQEGLLRGMLTGYHERWSERTGKMFLLATESVLTSPLTNLDTGRTSRSFSLAGKVDKIVEIDGAIAIVDHKTTSQNILDPAAPYWRQLQVDNQGQFYWCLALSNGLEVKHVIWDVVQKSTARPRKLTKVELANLTKEGTHWDRQCSDEAIAHGISEGTENPELFGWRISAQEMLKYQRVTLPRTNEELVEFNAQTWDIAQDILSTRRSHRHHKNPSACLLYNSPCEYLGVCSGHDTIESSNWMNVESVPPELGDEVPIEDSITNSRSTCFLTCRRKHLYRYELGRRRVKEETKEAFQFGSAWHSLMDQWWTLFCERA